MYTVKSTFSFEAAHRLYDVDTYSAECRENLHGHSYKLTVVLKRRSTQLNDAGMVIDFKLFKEIVNDEIVDQFDHSCILRDCDPIAPIIQENCKKVHIVHESPTAEWMCRAFYDRLTARLAAADPQLCVVRVEVQETENNIASYDLENTVWG